MGEKRGGRRRKEKFMSSRIWETFLVSSVYRDVDHKKGSVQELELFYLEIPNCGRS